jgi:hypothetical protein
MVPKPTIIGGLITISLLSWWVCLRADDGDKIDWNRARQIYQRVQSGETVSSEDRAYLESAKAARQKMQGGPGADRRAGSVSDRRPTPVLRLKPLCDMSASDRYKEEDGGLYGSGQNTPPAKHREAVLAQAKLICPLDSEGKPDSHGTIGLVSVGMSNTTMEFSQFMRLANADSQKSPQVVLVDGAQGGMDARSWSGDKTAPLGRGRDPWAVLDQRLQQAGVAPKQVQAAWLKQALAGPGMLGEFPKHAKELERHLITILQRLKQRFPNLRIVYLSSRIYAGNATTPLNPEPYTYESAFAVRWLIEEQMNGNRELAFDSNHGSAKAPLALWGPYLWADGEHGRKLDDLVWKPEDFGGDGTHPSASGQRKVADLLLKFFKTDVTTGWFTASATNKE